MQKDPILNIPLMDVMRPEIALPLHGLQLYTVGNFLRAWASPSHQACIEQIFDTPEQAWHAAAVCAAWLGIHSTFTPNTIPPVGWWRSDDQTVAVA